MDLFIPALKQTTVGGNAVIISVPCFPLSCKDLLEQLVNKLPLNGERKIRSVLTTKPIWLKITKTSCNKGETSLRAAKRQLLLLSPIYLRRLRITNDEHGWQLRGDRDLICSDGETQRRHFSCVLFSIGAHFQFNSPP